MGPPAIKRTLSPKPLAMTRNATITVLILVLVGGVAAWSKLRFIDGERYDAP